LKNERRFLVRYFFRAAAPVQIGFYPKLGATEKSEGSPPTDGPPAGTLNPKKDRDSEERMKTRSSQGETKAASKTVPTTPTTACNYCVSVAH